MSAEVTGFWSEAIHQGVRALNFSIQEVSGAPWMAAEIGREDVPAGVRRAAAAAIAVDKEIAYQTRSTPTSQARTALMMRLIRSSAADDQDKGRLLAVSVLMRSAALVEQDSYRRLLAVAVIQRVAADPLRLIEALAEPYE